VRRTVLVVGPLAVALAGVVIALPRPGRAQDACEMLDRVAREAVEAHRPGVTDEAASAEFVARVRLRVDYDLIAAAAPSSLAPAVEVGRAHAADLRAAIDAGALLPEATPEVLAADQAILRWSERTCR
jgi:hypothetical protein